MKSLPYGSVEETERAIEEARGRLREDFDGDGGTLEDRLADARNPLDWSGRVAAVRGAWPPQAWTLERKLLRHFGDHPQEAYLPGWDFSVIKKAESRSDGSLACTIDRSSECGYTKYGSHIVIYSDNRPTHIVDSPISPSPDP